jgi:hypothetical protein
LGASSGDATVANNTTGGNATSGSANAVADVVNMINSVISYGQSFLGVVNIYGNLTGNILVPSDLLNSLLATNDSTSAAPTNTTTTVNSTNDQAINNQINTAAQSGQASVDNNTNAGSATSGNATTNVTVFNLTGSQIVGSNSLLVFVNVLGQWVGFIMNAPAGTTAAALGGGITSDNTSNANTSTNNTNNSQINNDILAGANSGNASVNNNTTGGNATSGNSSASVNLLNLDNSDLSLSNWFGILFINVFGNWIGSLEAASSTSSTNTSSTPASSSPVSSAVSAVEVFRFAPTNNTNKYDLSSLGATSSSQNGSTDTSNSNNNKPTTTLVSYHLNKSGAVLPTDPSSSQSLNIVLLLIGAAGLGALGIGQYRSMRHRSVNK